MAAIFTIVLNVTFFILLLLEVIGEWAGSLSEDMWEGGHPMNFVCFLFVCLLHCKYIFFNFNVKPNVVILF